MEEKFHQKPILIQVSLDDPNVLRLWDTEALNFS